MADELHFDGDPAVDSRRRHLEQVLQGKPRRRWPWILALVAGGAWTAWRMTRPQESGSETRQQSVRG